LSDAPHVTWLNTLEWISADAAFFAICRDCSNSLMGDAYEISFRQDSRDEFMKNGKLLILIGFVLQFSGALP
jgi:hypothetical protein